MNRHGRWQLVRSWPGPSGAARPDAPNPGVTTDAKAQLEFMFLDALDRDDHAIPNLEKQIASSSAMFIQAVALSFKRTDGGIDPPEWLLSDPERRSSIASATCNLLDRTRRVPGSIPQPSPRPSWGFAEYPPRRAAGSTSSASSSTDERKAGRRPRSGNRPRAFRPGACISCGAGVMRTWAMG